MAHSTEVHGAPALYGIMMHGPNRKGICLRSRLDQGVCSLRRVSEPTSLVSFAEMAFLFSLEAILKRAVEADPVTLERAAGTYARGRQRRLASAVRDQSLRRAYVTYVYSAPRTR